MNVAAYLYLQKISEKVGTYACSEYQAFPLLPLRGLINDAMLASQCDSLGKGPVWSQNLSSEGMNQCSSKKFNNPAYLYISFHN